MKHLRSRIFIQILIPVLIVYVLISSYAFYFYRSSYKITSLEKKQTEMLNVSRVIGDWISSRTGELMTIARGEHPDNPLLAQEYLLDEAEYKSHYFDALWYVYPNGRYWNTKDQSGAITSTQDFDLLYTGKIHFLYYVPEEFSLYDPERMILFAVPWTRDDRVEGVICGSLPVGEMRRIMKLYTYSLFDEVALVDINLSSEERIGGRIIAHSNESGEGLHETEFFKKVYSVSTTERDEAYFVTTLINNWKIIGKIGNDSLFFQLHIMMRFFILATILLISVILIISQGIARAISNPILSLTRIVNRMLEGDFNNAISVNTQDELQSLAKAFNLLNKRNLQLRTDDRFSFLGRISSRMAHEIRHPLHVIQIALQTMTHENFEKNREIVNQEIRKADLFIREILEIAKPNELTLRHYSMARLVDRVYEKFSLICHEKRIDLKLSQRAAIDFFYFDVLKIEQVLTNILNNSCDALSPGGVINLVLENDRENHLLLHVSDTGPGFAKEVIDRVFDPYFTTKKEGTGLGLSICYQILTAHGAHIELSNKEEGGAMTTIIFSTLPGIYEK